MTAARQALAKAGWTIARQSGAGQKTRPPLSILALRGDHTQARSLQLPNIRWKPRGVGLRMAHASARSLFVATDNEGQTREAVFSKSI